MTAKEYYALYQTWAVAGQEREATEKLVQMMCADLQALMKKRGCKSEGAIEAAVNEFNSIWNAMRKLDPSFRRDGFKNLLMSRANDQAKKEQEDKKREFSKRFLEFFIFGKV